MNNRLGNYRVEKSLSFVVVVVLFFVCLFFYVWKPSKCDNLSLQGTSLQCNHIRNFEI